VGAAHTEITNPFTIELSHLDTTSFAPHKWTQPLWFASASAEAKKPADDSIYTIDRETKGIEWQHYFQAAFKVLSPF
jgi:hypothetical protein